MTREKMFSTEDTFLTFFLVILSLLTRIWMNNSPDDVVFDEIHFGNFTNWYIHRSFFFDIHPPLAKLIMAFVAKSAGYDGNINFVTKYENGKEDYYISLRLTPEIIQSFCSPLIYLSLRCFGVSSFGAFIGGIMILCENTMLVEGRYILSDGILHFFSCLHVFAMSYFFRIQSIGSLVFAGVSLGCAISCKYTALGLVAMTGLSQLFWIIKEKPYFRVILIRACCLIIPIIVIFFGSWFIHFVVLSYEGNGNPYVNKEFQSTIMGNNNYKGLRINGMSIIFRIVDMNIIMHTLNMKSVKPHPFQSSPIYWPFLFDKWVLFWKKKDRAIICLGSILIHYTITCFLFLSILLLFLKKLKYQHLFVLTGYIFSYFPFILVPRSMFLYHYIIPLIFGILETIMIIDIIFPRKVSYFLLFAILILSIFSYFYLYPFAYATNCDDKCFKRRQWINRWSEGPPNSYNSVMNYKTNEPNTTVLYGSFPCSCI